MTNDDFWKLEGNAVREIDIFRPSPPQRIN